MSVPRIFTPAVTLLRVNHVLKSLSRQDYFSSLLSHLSFKSDGAFPTQCCVASIARQAILASLRGARIIEVIDVFKDSHLSLPPCFPRMSPDQFRFDDFEERPNSRIVIAISFSTHGHFEAVLSQDLSIVVRTTVRSAIRVMPSRQIALQSPAG